MKFLLRGVLNFMLVAAILAGFNAFGWVHLYAWSLPGPGVHVATELAVVILALLYALLCALVHVIGIALEGLGAFTEIGVGFLSAVLHVESESDSAPKRPKKRVSLHLGTAVFVTLVTLGVGWLFGGFVFPSVLLALALAAALLLAEVVPALALPDFDLDLHG